MLHSSRFHWSHKTRDLPIYFPKALSPKREHLIALPLPCFHPYPPPENEKHETNSPFMVFQTPAAHYVYPISYAASVRLFVVLATTAALRLFGRRSEKATYPRYTAPEPHHLFHMVRFVLGPASRICRHGTNHVTTLFLPTSVSLPSTAGNHAIVSVKSGGISPH